ncbi:MAG TPA: hypothetical protein ENG42_01595 [Candidatus Aenigmarchaeota archaeon]|nr:MAG: hypothetical protein DRP03_01990 [Candidatus Aenigmarchaeota archaeon]HDD46144.1 hypothetical protein [Candidatus Aenigmarchaeota archaeon]
MKRIVFSLAMVVCLFFSVSAIRPDKNTVMEIRLYLNNTNATIYVPSKPPFVSRANALSYRSFTKDDLSHLYVISYEDDALLGLIFSSDNFVNIQVNKNPTSYVISMKLNLTGSQVFLPFTKAEQKQIEKRMRSVEDKTFLETNKPSFAFPLKKNQEIMIYLAYQNINFTSNLTSMGIGYHRLVIDNLGVVNNKLLIGIRRI